MEILMLAFGGLLSGFLAGWLGLGGMSILIPVFLASGYSLPEAFANSFAVTAINGAIAWRVFHRQQAIDYRMLRGMLVPAAITSSLSFAGMLFAGLGQSAGLLFGAFLVFMGLAMWRLQSIESNNASNKPRQVVWGAIGGCISGIFGFNGNAFFIPLFRRYGLTTKQSIANAQVSGTCIACCAAMIYAIWGCVHGHGLLNLGLVLLTAGMGVMTSKLGCALKARTSSLVLSILLSSLYLLSGGLMLIRLA
jgi:uncharacterized membrane protein YfcA